MWTKGRNVWVSARRWETIFICKQYSPANNIPPCTLYKKYLIPRLFLFMKVHIVHENEHMNLFFSNWQHLPPPDGKWGGGLKASTLFIPMKFCKSIKWNKCLNLNFFSLTSTVEQIFLLIFWPSKMTRIMPWPWQKTWICKPNSFDNSVSSHSFLCLFHEKQSCI